MSEVGESVPDQKRDISRRKFLAVMVAGGVGTLAVGYPRLKRLLLGEGELGASQLENVDTDESIPKFFESIEDYSDEMLEKVRLGLVEFGNSLGGCFEKMGFSGEVWGETVERITSTLGHVARQYKALEERGLFKTGEERKLFANEYYELGSGMWAVLRVGELYGENPDELRRVVEGYAQRGFVRREGELVDELLGEELLGIEAGWADTGLGLSPVIELLGVNRITNVVDGVVRLEPKDNRGRFYLGLDRLVERLLPNQSLVRGIDALGNYQPDLEVRNRFGLPRPQETGYRGTEKAVNQMKEILSRYGLTRVMSLIRTEYTGDRYRGVFDPLERIAGISEKLFVEDYQKEHPNQAEHVVVHEAGHAVSFLAKCPEDPLAAGRLRLVREGVLKGFRPYDSLGKIFHPDSDVGKYEECRVIDQATLTNYASRQTIYPKDRSNRLNVSENSLDKKGYVRFLINQCQDSSPLDRRFFVMLMEEIPTEDLPDEVRTIGDYLEYRWEELIKVGLSPLELAVLERIKAEGGELSFSVFESEDDFGEVDIWKDKWQERLYVLILDAVLSEMVVSSPDEFGELLFETFPDMDEQQKRVMAHRLATTRKLIGVERHKADEELFAEIFAYSLRSESEGVVIENLPKEMDIKVAQREMKSLVQELVDLGFAASPGKGKKENVLGVV